MGNKVSFRTNQELISHDVLPAIDNTQSECIIERKNKDTQIECIIERENKDTQSECIIERENKDTQSECIIERENNDTQTESIIEREIEKISVYIVLPNYTYKWNGILEEAPHIIHKMSEIDWAKRMEDLLIKQRKLCPWVS